MLSSGGAERRDITWGVDGYGVRHFICADCEKYLGVDEDAAERLECSCITTFKK